MSVKPTQPESSNWLRLLTGNRLQTQVSRSGALEGGALGVMGVDVAVALIVIGGGGAYGLSILALLLLGFCSGSRSAWPCGPCSCRAPRKPAPP
jgi:hypothetical protein